MASIKTQLVLSDGMTAPLKGINKALNLVLNSFESMQKASGKSIDTAALQEARDELAKVGASLDQVEQKTQKTSSTFGQLAKAIGLAAIARQTFNAVKSGVDYASDLAEVQNVVDVTFGSSAAVIDDWSKTCLKAYGMNEVSAKKYAGTLGAMMKSSGITGDAVTQMSQDMVGLAGDMASFYNLDLETAFTKIRSGISGETEPLKQLGINMSVANLEAYALSQGIETAYSEMSQAEQVMLRYNYLMSSTADAQGDFARTQDSWANQTRLLSESWTQFKGELATQLLPVLTAVATALNDIVQVLVNNADTVGAVLVGLATTVGILAAAWAIHAAAQWLAVAANQALVASLLTNPLTGIAVLIGAVIAVIYKWVQSLGGLQNAWELVKLYLISRWNTVKLAFFTGVYAVMGMVDKLKLCWEGAGVAIAGFMGDMKVKVLTLLQNMVNGAIDIINNFISALNNIPGVTLSAVEHVTFAATAAAENEAAKTARAADLNASKKAYESAKAEREAKLNALAKETGQSLINVELAKAQFKASANATKAQDSASDALDGIGSDTAAISDNTGSAANTLSSSMEDLKYLRDIAEQEAINRFTTAEISVSMGGVTNNVSSDTDLDGVINYLASGIQDAMSVAAEGVHI